MTLNFYDKTLNVYLWRHTRYSHFEALNKCTIKKVDQGTYFKIAQE